MAPDNIDLTQQLAAIYAAQIEPSSFQSIRKRQWEKAPLARPLTPQQVASLDSVGHFAARASLPQQWDAVLAGTCHLFTGDLARQSSEHHFKAAQVVRLDQLLLVMGVKNQSLVFYNEDHLFADLTGLDMALFTRQAQECLRYAERLGQLMGVSDVQMVCTSTYADEISASVTAIAQEIGAPHFVNIHPAPVLAMYTYHWADILAAAGILPSHKLIFITSSNHYQKTVFFKDEQAQQAYDAFFEWIKTEPYAHAGKHEHFGAVGCFPCFSADGRQKRTRLLPYTAVINSENWATWGHEFYACLEKFPFALKSNRIFCEATNYLLWRADVVTDLYQLTCLENQYLVERKTVKEQDDARLASQKLRQHFQQAAYPLLANLASQLETFLAAIFSDR